MNPLEYILQDTYTLHDLKHRTRILKSFLEQHIFGSTTAEQFSPEDTDWLKQLTPQFIAQFNKNNFTNQFKLIEEAITKLETIIIYLPFQADQNTVGLIQNWFQKNLSKKMLLDIKIDPNLIGGCALVQGGIYKEYSLRTKIQDQKEVILSEFKKYFR